MEEACLGVGSLLFQVIRGVTSSKMTSLRLVPSECTSIQETMETLALNFSIDSVVVEALLDTKIQNLEEFRFLFEDESKVDTFLAKIPLGEDRLIQGSRLRRAWTAVMLYYKTQDQDRSKISLSDLDTMLADSELRDVKSRQMPRCPESVESSPSACCACTVCGKFGLSSTNCIQPRRSASWRKGSTPRRSKMTTELRMIGKAIWTECCRSCWHTLWRE